jgi:hypothetical protein
VEYPVRRSRVHRVLRLPCVEEVGDDVIVESGGPVACFQRMAPEACGGRARTGCVIGQVAPGEAGRAGDEDMHGRERYLLGLSSIIAPP